MSLFRFMPEKRIGLRNGRPMLATRDFAGIATAARTPIRISEPYPHPLRAGAGTSARKLPARAQR